MSNVICMREWKAKKIATQKERFERGGINVKMNQALKPYEAMAEKYKKVAKAKKIESLGLVKNFYDLFMDKNKK